MKKGEKRTGAKMSPKETAFQAVERNGDEIAKIGDSVFYFAELGMQEVETCRLLVGVLRGMGYTVETGISGFPTGFLASYGSGKPVIAVHVEYDALPSGSQTPGAVERRELVPGAPGHAEGHNTNPAVMVGAAFAIKEAIDKHRLAGTVKLFGSPAEEQLVSRSFFVRDGLFRDVDAALHVHVGDEFSVVYGVRSSALISVEYEFFGKTAHAGNAPWLGVSAADAAKLMDIGWDVLREHLPPTQRSHSVIKDGGVQPNVVPDYARIWWYFREATARGAAELFGRARKMAEGACLMTGATHRETVVAACWPNWDNKPLAELVQANIELVGMPELERGGSGPGPAGPEGRRPPGDWPGDEGDTPDAGKTERRLLRLRGHHLRRPPRPDPLPGEHPRHRGAPLVGGDCPGHPDRPQGRGGRREGTGRDARRPADRAEASGRGEEVVR